MKSIEKLIVWLIPAELLGILLPAILTAFTAGVSSGPGPRSLFSLLAFLSSLSFLIGHAVIAVWLLYQPHKTISSSRVWFCFGFVAGFAALGIYLLMQIPSVRSALEPNGAA
jgi:hypothetical protein